jgi:phage shock protein PspC (stress-responsive transcriptional regulator)
MTTSDAGTGPTMSPPPGAGGAPRLVRRRDDRQIAGVCAALGSYTGIDPVIYRVVLAVLALFGGAGLVLYGVGWLLIPEQETGRAALDTLLRRPAGWSDWRRLALIAAVLLLAVVVLPPIRHASSWTGLGLAVLAVLGFLWLRDHRPDALAAGAAPTSATVDHAEGRSYALAATTYDPGATHLGATHDPRATAPLPAPAPRRPRSPLGWITLCAALVAVGCGLLLDGAGMLHATLQGLLATALVVVSIGLVAGTWIGRARWLVLPAFVLVVALAGASVISGVPLRGGTGDRFWAPGAAGDLPSEYRLLAGDATLDLTGLGAVSGGRSVRASVGAGQLAVRLPAGLPVSVHAHAGGGRVEVLGLVSDGLGVDRDVTSGGPNVGAGAVAGLVLDLRVGAGQLTVTRVTP